MLYFLRGWGLKDIKYNILREDPFLLFACLQLREVGRKPGKCHNALDWGAGAVRSRIHDDEDTNCNSIRKCGCQTRLMLATCHDCLDQSNHRQDAFIL